MSMPIESSVNLRNGESTAKVNATTDPITGVTDLDSQSLNAAVNVLQPGAAGSATRGPSHGVAFRSFC